MASPNFFPDNNDSDVKRWLPEIIESDQVLARLQSLRKYLKARAISSKQAQTNRHCFDLIMKAERLYTDRQSKRAAAYFWEYRQNEFISELTAGSILSAWRHAQLAARYQPEHLYIWSQGREHQPWPVLCATIEQSRNCPQLLAKFARHSSAAVRIAVADNTYTDLTTMLALSSDENPDVRFAIAENHNAPGTVLDKLAMDDNPYVADRARRTLSRLVKTDVYEARFDRAKRARKHLAAS